MGTESNWLSALISPSFLAALIGALFNVYIGTKIKHQTDQFSSQFSGTYKIREQLAGEFLALSFKTREILNRHNETRNLGTVDSRPERENCEALLNDLILIQSKSRIYFPSDVYDEMSQIIIQLQVARTYTFHMNLGANEEKIAENRNFVNELLHSISYTREKIICDLFREILVPPLVNKKKLFPFKIPTRDRTKLPIS